MARADKNGGRRPKKKGRELVRDSKWVRTYRDKPNVWTQTSKFLEGRVDLQAQEFESIWAKLSLREKLDVCTAYTAKAQISEEDEKILDVIMRKGDDVTWSNIVSVLTRHTDRERVSHFIRGRIQKQPPPLANFYQAVEMLGDTAAIPLLKKKHHGYGKKRLGPQSRDRISCIDYLTCSMTLWKLTGLQEYKQTIDRFVPAEDEFVKDCATRLLKRSAE
jgi:hypothetical protein